MLEDPVLLERWFGIKGFDSKRLDPIFLGDVFDEAGNGFSHLLQLKHHLANLSRDDTPLLMA